MSIVDVQKVAAFPDVTPRRVGKQGMPRRARGQNNPIKRGIWCVRYLQAAIEKKTVPTKDGVHAARIDVRVLPLPPQPSRVTDDHRVFVHRDRLLKSQLLMDAATFSRL